MKRIILFLLAPVLIGACKKDKNGAAAPKTVLLSRSLYDGHNNNRYFYNADNLLIRFESYNDEPPNGLTSYALIEYDAKGHITQLTSYQSPGEIATNRTLVQYNGSDQIESAQFYDLQGATPNTPSSSQTWKYNAKGDWISMDTKDKNNKLLRRVNLSYYADGSLKQTDEYKENSNQLYLVAKSIYSVPGGFYPPGLDQMKILLGPDLTGVLFNETIQHYSYDQNGVITYNSTLQMSGREYNANGSLAKQTITIKRIKPANTDLVHYAEYEYIEQ